VVRDAIQTSGRAALFLPNAPNYLYFSFKLQKPADVVDALRSAAKFKGYLVRGAIALGEEPQNFAAHNGRAFQFHRYISLSVIAVYRRIFPLLS
jgi:hypothetical protein